MSLLTRPNELSLEKIIPLSTSNTLRNNFMVLDEELPANIRFGLLLEIMDTLAADTARLYVNQFYKDAVVVTAAIDTIIVRNPADIARDLVFKSRINYVGKTSMEVGIRIEQPNPQTHIATCYFTLVARRGPRDNRVSVALPPLNYIDDMEKRRYQKAIERKEHYMAQKNLESQPPSLEEYRLLEKLHKAQEDQNFNGLLASKLFLTSWERTFPAYKNPNQTIFGGYLARRSYELSTMCAELIATKRPIIAAVNRMNFINPVKIGDKLLFKSNIVYTHKSFICIETTISRMGRYEKKISNLTDSCLFTFVNVDEKLKPYPVETIYPLTYFEDQKYLEARRSLTAIISEIKNGLLKESDLAHFD
ncbi:acyl-CoA thioesterase [Desulfurella sp.]|uniref:acyl-CoA thioesterase n=1 Tax=Desulfurella sp. TaxID=1962857 RepID=UPI0025BA319E|nr:acyl-CoA thioesterase [Desulfurella sp.]